MNKKKSVSGIFFSMFLRTVVIILAIVIVAMGVVLVKQKLNRKNTDIAGDSEVDESILTEEDGQDVLLGSPEDNTGGEEGGAVQQNTSFDKKIVVLNGTETKGLAGHWRDTLASYGYQNLDAKNYYSRLEQTKVLAAEDGVGTDLLQYFPNADYQVGTLTSDETDASVDGVDIFVIIGTSDDVLSQQ